MDRWNNSPAVALSAAVVLLKYHKPCWVGSPSVEAFRWLASGPMLLCSGNRRCNSDCHRLGNLVLHREDVGEVAVITLSPDMLAGLRLDQLCGDADAIAALRRLPSRT